VECNGAKFAPTPGSDREKMFKDYSQQLRNGEQESVPFIGVPEIKIMYAS